MKAPYSYLKDELAIQEIKKHKWIESEKSGSEIGFATAAIDWIRRFGQGWLMSRIKNHSQDDTLVEKRHYRRFPYAFPLNVQIKNKTIQCKADDVSLMGVSCTLPVVLPQNSSLKVAIKFNSKRRSNQKAEFHFKSRIQRSLPIQRQGQKIASKVFLLFNEEVRNFVRLRRDFFQN